MSCRTTARTSKRRRLFFRFTISAGDRQRWQHWRSATSPRHHGGLHPCKSATQHSWKTMNSSARLQWHGGSIHGRPPPTGPTAMPPAKDEHVQEIAMEKRYRHQLFVRSHIVSSQLEAYRSFYSCMSFFDTIVNVLHAGIKSSRR